MNDGRGPSIPCAAREKFGRIASGRGLPDRDVSVVVKTLTPEEAIGMPGRRDFPMTLGQERVIEVDFRGSKAHAFTDSPKGFAGPLRQVMDFSLASNGERALFVAVMNAVLKCVGVIGATLHCRDDEPEQCGAEISAFIKDKPGLLRIGLIGLNPAIADKLSRDLGSVNLRITDLNPKNIGTMKFGVEVWDGRERAEELVRESDLAILTGTTLANGTFDDWFSLIEEWGKDYLVFGVTAAGVGELMGLKRICPFGRK